MEQPVGHQYDGSAYDPNPVLLALSSRPPQPVLPRQQVSCRSSSLKTRRERIPLTSSLTGLCSTQERPLNVLLTTTILCNEDTGYLCAGPGRAGTETTLLGSHGSKYCGQVLSGRPHGSGQYWAQVCCSSRWLHAAQHSHIKMLAYTSNMNTPCPQQLCAGHSPRPAPAAGV